MENILSSVNLTDIEKNLIEKVSSQVHRKDGMYEDSALEYLSLGLSAVRVIQEALHSARKERELGAILDFPCGHGRVLRFLRLMFPISDITVAEIDSTALDFCRRNFSVTTLLSKKTFSDLSLPQRFDLIWCGSLFTHIDEPTARDLLRFFYDHLSDRGLCILTTHGQRSIEWIQSKYITYRLAENDQQKIIREFQSEGYGFVDFPKHPGYGISAVSHQRMLELARGVGNWDETFFLEHGWGNHQDVYAFAMQEPNKGMESDKE